jgi:hypothetical protein
MLRCSLRPVSPSAAIFCGVPRGVGCIASTKKLPGKEGRLLSSLGIPEAAEAAAQKGVSSLGAEPSGTCTCASVQRLWKCLTQTELSDMRGQDKTCMYAYRYESLHLLVVNEAF